MRKEEEFDLLILFVTINYLYYYNSNERIARRRKKNITR